jgi:acyl-CoA synthetase (AMP-forming)/AMP-acid ligase II
MPNLASYLLSRVRSAPDAPAIAAGTHGHDFGTIWRRVERIAGSMSGPLGLAPGARVVVWMENRLEFYELLFACWSAGLVAVPANAKLHPKEIGYIVADCGASAVFVGESLEPGLRAGLSDSGAAPQVIVIGSQAYERLAAGPARTPAPCAPTDVAWLFYTSGTTGRPKGAMLTHRNLVFMTLAYLADIENVWPGDTMLHAAPLSHGAGLYGLAHLLAGGRQVVLPGFEPQDVLEAFEALPNVSMFAAPTMVTRLLQAAGSGVRARGLRTICYGGGPMYVSDLVRARSVFGPRLYQLYGQGESPMTITGLNRLGHEGDGAAAHLARLGSCGLPRTGVEVRIVDAEGRALEVGEVGEVTTRSDCVMAGYWGNAAASASALRDGWLWTGDVGSLDERGYLTLRDRSKDLIISGGSNIYPREIEEVLLRHPSVLECSVIGHPHPDWGEEVVAFVVARPGATIDPAALDALCLDNIARFKRPKQYRVADALPKNNYGKVLKTALRASLATG